MSFKLGDRVVIINLKWKSSDSNFEIGSVAVASELNPAYCGVTVRDKKGVLTDGGVFPYEHLMLEEIWNSPLMKALREEA